MEHAAHTAQRDTAVKRKFDRMGMSACSGVHADTFKECILKYKLFSDFCGGGLFLDFVVDWDSHKKRLK